MRSNFGFGGSHNLQKRTITLTRINNHPVITTVPTAEEQEKPRQQLKVQAIKRPTKKKTTKKSKSKKAILIVSLDKRNKVIIIFRNCQEACEKAQGFGCSKNSISWFAVIMTKRPHPEDMDHVEVGVVYNRSELDLFTSPKELDPIDTSYDVSVLPITSLDNQGEVTFIIPPTTDEWTDLAQTTLAIVVQVVKEDGSYLEEELKHEVLEGGRKGPKVTPEVSIPNLFFAALIRKMIVELNGVEIGAGSHSHFPQISLIKCILNNSASYAERILKHGIGWDMDLGSQHRKTLDVARYDYIKGSRHLTLVATLNNDIFNTTRLIPPDITTRIRLERSTPEYALIRKEGLKQNFKIKWLQAQLTTKRIKLNDRVRTSISRGLNSKSPIYLPFTKLESRTFEIPQGAHYHRAHGIFQGVLPERVLLVILETEATGFGDYSCNPMVFPARDYNVSGIQFFVGDKAVLPEPYAPKWETGSYEKEFQALVKVMGINTNPAVGGTVLSYKWFGRDYGIFAANIRGHDGKNQGMVSVEVRFSKGAPKTLAGMIIGEFKSCAVINEEKKIETIDY